MNYVDDLIIYNVIVDNISESNVSIITTNL